MIVIEFRVKNVLVSNCVNREYFTHIVTYFYLEVTP